MDETSSNMTGRGCFDVVTEKSGTKSILMHGLALNFDKLTEITRLLNGGIHSISQQDVKTFLEIHLDATETSATISKRSYTGHEQDAPVSYLIQTYSQDDLLVCCLGVSCGFWSCRMYGVLLLRQPRARWRRLGLCFWETNSAHVGKVISTLTEFDDMFQQLVACRWTEFKGAYGEISKACGRAC
ncbi:hypothetical protein BU26DRAFT_515210 [Trematosphaeria pertusa]|uniref:Uncharacterized protein n=1 Tax=Trematosphaeria pertusa TaxID=390896 RepID=A0A6A6IT93_9PLEO|nr:uncharacterized protein BU26DRAFT_515210 [Trematosphaeria pertusa]KAF2252753.1 hypothetical protein BU26DRAFT_515210 [Trematosphaeria pertusa]